MNCVFKYEGCLDCRSLTFDKFSKTPSNFKLEIFFKTAPKVLGFGLEVNGETRLISVLEINFGLKI